MHKFQMPKSVTHLIPKLGLLAMAILVFAISIAQAVELPPDFSTAFIQTSGPNTPINVGDYYTSFQGAQEPHFVRINIPCTWPGDLPLTFALFDPEVQEPDPSVLEPPAADDEIRNDAGVGVDNPPTENIQFADITTYTLFAIRPGDVLDQVVGPVTFVPTSTITNTTNGRWVELVTFTPNTPGFGCGVYVLATETSDNDDNAWKLSVSHDPDCTVSVAGPGSCSGIGQAQSDLLSDGDEQDDADNTLGTGDELLLSLDQITYQHEAPDNTSLTCQQFFHPVFPDDAPEILLHNFDLDINNNTGFNSTVRHFSPSGDIIDGIVSRNQAWNGAADPPPFPPQRGGDLIPIAPEDVGLWVTEICVRRGNQYIYEGQQDEVIFLQPPPIPRMRVAKDDGRVFVAPNDSLTYAISFTNVSDTDPYPLPPPINAAPPGAAFNVTLTDQLPPFTTFVACQVNPPFTGTCAENPPGVVTIRINEIIAAGAGGTAAVTVQVNSDAPPGLITDTISLTYTGILGIEYPPVIDIDIDEILPQPPTPTLSTTPTPQPAPSATPSPTPKGEGGGESKPPTPPPAPTATPEMVAPQPTVTPTATEGPLPVALLPETGSQEAVWGPFGVGIALFLAALLGLIILRGWTERTTQTQKDS